MIVDSHGSVFVSDTGNNRVQVYRSDFSFLTRSHNITMHAIIMSELFAAGIAKCNTLVCVRVCVRIVPVRVCVREVRVRVAYL